VTRSLALGVSVLLTLILLIVNGHAGADPLARSESPLRVGERLRITVSTAASTRNPFRTARRRCNSVQLRKTSYPLLVGTPHWDGARLIYATMKKALPWGSRPFA